MPGSITAGCHAWAKDSEPLLRSLERVLQAARSGGIGVAKLSPYAFVGRAPAGSLARTPP